MPHRLLADMTRCTGDSGQAENDFLRCPVRDQCARHRDYFANHLPEPVSCMFAPDNCTQFIQYDEPETD